MFSGVKDKSKKKRERKKKRKMGGFMSKMWQWIFSLPEFKIITVGLDNAGKTTIVYRLVLNDVVATTPTVGSNVEELVYKNLKFLVWDLGGQTVLRDTWSTYYTNTHAVIFVVDSTDRERISCAKEEFIKLLGSDVLTHKPLLNSLTKAIVLQLRTF